ncbi:hypothetical protein ACOME3_009675 [Neoechinorhynchus agilis]
MLKPNNKPWAAAVETLYCYVRSIAISVPYPWTRGNLQMFLSARISSASTEDGMSASRALEIWTIHLSRVFAHLTKQYFDGAILDNQYGENELRDDIGYLINEGPFVILMRDNSECSTPLFIMCLFIYLLDECKQCASNRRFAFELFVTILHKLIEFVGSIVHDNYIYRRKDELLPALHIGLLYYYKIRIQSNEWFDDGKSDESGIWIAMAKLMTSLEVTKHFEAEWSFQRRNYLLDEEEELREFNPLRSVFVSPTLMAVERARFEKSTLSMSKSDQCRLRRIRMIGRLEEFLRKAESHSIPIPLMIETSNRRAAKSSNDMIDFTVVRYVHL